jgi:hypothetical protein
MAALRSVVATATRVLIATLLVVVTQVLAWYWVWPLALAVPLGWRTATAKVAILLGLGFLPLFYLREFQVAPSLLLLLYLALPAAVVVARR